MLNQKQLEGVLFLLRDYGYLGDVAINNRPEGGVVIYIDHQIGPQEHEAFNLLAISLSEVNNASLFVQQPGQPLQQYIGSY